jgi:hypothetical protein
MARAAETYRAVSPLEIAVGPDYLCLALIAAFPFWNTVVMTTGPFGADTLRATNVLAVLAFISFIRTNNPFQTKDALERAATLCFIGFVAFFALSWARSLPNLPRYHELSPDVLSDSPRAYFDEQFVAPALMAMSFIYVLRTACSGKGLSRVFDAISLAILVESVVIILAVLSDPAKLDTPERKGMADLMATVMGTHYNQVGTSYTITAPLLVWLALKRGGIHKVTCLLALGAVLCLESRTSLFAFVAMGVLTTVVMGRAKTLLALLPILTTAAMVALGPVLIAIVTLGFTQRSGFSLFFFLSARDTSIWLPLLLEWWNDPYRFWFGAGEYGILTSDMLITGRMADVSQAHNAYLEFLLDNGAAFLAVWVALLVNFLTWAYRMGKRVQHELYWVLLLCVVSFLVSCFTGRQFVPNMENALMFPILAALINVARLRSAVDHKLAKLKPIQSPSPP